MRYRAYLHGGVIAPSESQRVSDHYDDAPNAWTFGIYVDGELCSSLRLNVLTSEWRMSCVSRVVRRCSSPAPRSGRSFHRSGSVFVADPGKGPAVSGASLSDGAAGLSGLRVFQRRYRARARSCRAPGVLSPGLSARDHRRTAFVSGLIAKGGIDGVRFPGRAGTRHDPVSHHALKCIRAADAVPACGITPSGMPRYRPSSAPQSFRVPEAACAGTGPEFAVRPAAALPNPRANRPSDRGAGAPKAMIPASARLPSPSRHIYKSLTIVVAFRGLSAFDRVWQHSIKVDGTFA